MKKQATDYIFNKPSAKYCFGFNDGINDAQRGVDRGEIEHGETFCLPLANEHYCNGYKDGQASYNGTRTYPPGHTEVTAIAKQLIEMYNDGKRLDVHFEVLEEAIAKATNG